MHNEHSEIKRDWSRVVQESTYSNVFDSELNLSGLDSSDDKNKIYDAP